MDLVHAARDLDTLVALRALELGNSLRVEAAAVPRDPRGELRALRLQPSLLLAVRDELLG